MRPSLSVTVRSALLAVSRSVPALLAVVALFAGEAVLGHAVEAQATLSLTPATQDFGSVALGRTSAVVVFTVVNRGTSPTKGLSVGLGGTGATDFAITVNNCGAALSPGGTCAVSVNFAPRSIGVKAASLDLKSNPGGMVRANLSGTGSSGLLSCATGQTMQNGVCVTLTAGTTICPTGQTMQNGVCVNLTTGTIACPTGQTMQNGVCVNLAAGTTTTACPTGVANGTGGCTTTQLACSAGQTMQNGMCVNLAAGTTTTACPSGVANGTGGCTVTQTTTCPTGQTMQNGVCVNLTTGTTTCPTGMVYGPGGCTMITLSVGPISRDFGSVPTGTASTSFTFTVVNTSTVSVSGISVVLSGVNASSFVIASSTCASLPAGGTCGVAVRFSPSSVGTRTASLDVTATMSGGASAGLTGTAIP